MEGPVAALLLIAAVGGCIWLYLSLSGEEKQISGHAETKALFDQAHALYAATAGKFDRTQFIVASILDAGETVGVWPPDSIFFELCKIVELLLIEEGYWHEPVFNWSSESTLTQQLAMREAYRRKIRFYQDYERRTEAWRTIIMQLVAVVLSGLPETALPEQSEDDDAPTFSVPLISLFERPVDLLQGALAAIINEDTRNRDLFMGLRDRLSENIYRASGVKPSQEVKTHQTLVVPATAKGQTPLELVQTFYGGTALELLFSHPLAFAIPDDARFEHCHILGGTGHGKTQLLQLLIYQDLLKAGADGRSVIVIDSQGDMIRTLSRLALFAPGAENSLADRLVIVDPTDIEYPVALNMFDCRQDRIDGYSLVEREKLLNGVIALYSYLFGALLGAELTDKQGVIFKFLARLMLAIPDATIHTMRELMEDATPFKRYIAVLDPTTRHFFETQFFSRSFVQTKQQIARRLWSVLSHSTLDRMFSQTKSSLDLFEAMNSGKIILINTAKDLLKDDGSQVLGRFFISMIVQAAMERATIPAEQRTPCYVYVDEAQEYFDESVSDLLIQARKYKVSLTSAHQTLDQLSPALRSTMMTNTSTKLIGGVSAKDARAFAEEMRCQADYLQNIRKHKDETEFACWIRNVTPSPLTLFVPLGAVERQSTLSDAEYGQILSDIRNRYCVHWDGTLPAAPGHQPPAHAEETEYDRVQMSPEPAEPLYEPVTRPTKRASVPVEPAPMGQGGQKHVYIQTLIKRCAEERGWRAIVEKPTADGQGRIDVSLEKGNRKVACEISVTTTVAHELGNVRKCLESGYSRVLVVATDAKRFRALEQYMAQELNADELKSVAFILPEGVVDFLDAPETVQKAEQKTVRGYRVKVKRTGGRTTQSTAPHEAIAQIIAKSLRR